MVYSQEITSRQSAETLGRLLPNQPVMEAEMAAENPTEPISEKPTHGNFKDLTGHQYGRLRVLYLSSGRTPAGNRRWHCRCECGAECDVMPGALRSGGTQSCGCLHRERVSKFRDLTGQRFGRWEVISIPADRESYDYRVECRCEC